MIKKNSMKAIKAIKAMRQAAVTVTAAVALALTGCTGQEDFIDGGDTPAQGVTPVSYTHLTLPTTERV